MGWFYVLEALGGGAAGFIGGYFMFHQTSEKEETIACTI